MSTLKKNISILLMMLLEVAIGIFLLINPEGLTTVVVICFGVFLMIAGLIGLIRYLKQRKKRENSVFSLIWAIILMALGIFAISGHSLIISLFAFIAIFYGVILLISGIFKVITYISARKALELVSAFSIISAIFSVILGGVILVNPFETTHILFVFSGIAILVSAAFDLMALILIIRAGKKTINEGYVEVKVLDEE